MTSEAEREEAGWRGKRPTKQQQGTNTGEDKREKRDIILLLEKHGCQTIATICR